MNKISLQNAEFWINKEGQHPKPLTIIWAEDIVENINEAINGKWITSDNSKVKEVKNAMMCFNNVRNPLCIMTENNDELV